MPQSPADPDDVFSSGGGAPTFDLLSYALAARKFWWLIVLGLGGGLVAGLVAVQMTPPEYISSAEIKVERRAASSAISLSGGPLAFEGATAPEDLKTIEKSFASPMLMRRVAAEIRKANFKGLSFHGHAAESLDDEAVAGYLMQDCSVELIPDTRLIRISFTNSDPLMAQKITELIVNEGIQIDLDQRIAASGTNIRYLREEVKKFEENLRTSEEKLNSYTRTLGNVSIDADMNIVATQLRELNSRSTAAKAERLRIESDYAQVQTALDDPAQLMKIESIQKLPAIVSLSSQIAEARGRIDKLSLRYRDSNPFMKQARTELAGLEAALRQEILQAPKLIESALASARRNEENILREQAIQEEKVIQVRDLAVPSRVLQRQIDADRMAYEAALKRLSEELSQARNQPVLLQVVNPAGYGYPGGSKPIRLLAVALFIGAMAGFGSVFLITQLDTSVKSPEEAERILGASVLASVPEFVPPREGTAAPATSVHEGFEAACPALGAMYSPTAEAIRALRAALRSIDEDEPGSAVLVTGAREDDGASFTAANLAIVLAQAGQRTLLIDSNLREPALELRVFGSCGRVGLTEFLHREAGFASIIHSSPIPMLDLIPAGRPCPFPAEALSRDRLATLLDEARPLYDKIVVDAAALTTFSDALGGSRLFPLVCLVIRAGRTPKAAARRSIELLQRSGSRLTGLVLNATQAPFQNRFLEAALPVAERETGLSGFSCPSCNRHYHSLADFVARTTEATSPQKPAAGVSKTGVFRRCACGHEFGPKSGDLRDNSPAGDERRQVFGDLLRDLEVAGLAPEEARRHLLLTLKLWRNERFDESHLTSSRAGSERSRLLEQLIEQLGRAGLSRDEARRKIQAALETWRSPV